LLKAFLLDKFLFNVREILLGVEMKKSTNSLPCVFKQRRLHSLMGLWLTLFLIEHLFTNSQAAWVTGNMDSGFVRFVNFLGNIPYLHIIEVVFLGIPILYHMIWGILYMFRSKYHVFSGSGNKPNLSKEGANHRFAWQRWTAWILVFGIILHVAQMRFIEHPVKIKSGESSDYIVKLSFDPGLYKLTDSLDFSLLGKQQIIDEKENEKKLLQELELKNKPSSLEFSQESEKIVQLETTISEKQQLNHVLENISLGNNDVLALSPSFGVANLLVIRDTFKQPLFCILYTIFVLSAAYHAFNGLWTFCISWGVLLTQRSQVLALRLCAFLTLLLSFLGLSAIWLTYWVNLR
jgi:succinate dehydrogenase / fumarate reductase cytochrome b subunit